MRTVVTYSLVEGTATISLNNPDRRNALSLRMFGELSDVLSEVQQDQDVRVVILTGTGESFCVGADLAAPPEQRSLQGTDVDADIVRLRAATRVAEQLYRLPQPTIAAVNGPCAGAGLSLAAATDFRVASTRAVFNTAFLTAGVSGDLCGIWFVVQIVGSAKARELFMTPSKFDAHTAMRMGLVGSVAEPDDLANTVQQLADRLASSAPVALRAMKRNLIAADVAPLHEYAHDEISAMVDSFHTEDAHEAAAAFIGKRRPVFFGK